MAKEKKTKTGTTTKEERKLLEQAGKIIRRELGTGQDVYVRGFGRFNISTASVNMAGPGATEDKRTTIGIVRFRPYDALKKAVREVNVSLVEPTVVEVIDKKVAEGIDKAKKEAAKQKTEPLKGAPKRPKPQPVSKIDWG